MKEIQMILISIILFSCVSQKNVNTHIVWINSTKTPCEGVVPMQCLKIKESKNIEDKNKSWELFYDRIEGFKYEEGYVYKLLIRKEKIDPNLVPADASSIKYTLLKILEKKKVSNSNILEWNLSLINGEKVTKKVTLQIKKEANKIYGKGFCNRYFGELKKYTNTEFKLDKGIVSTRMHCPESMKQERLYFKLLEQAKFYKQEEKQLILFDKDNKDILVFKR